jgi:hypothetical protein
MIIAFSHASHALTQSRAHCSLFRKRLHRGPRRPLVLHPELSAHSLHILPDSLSIRPKRFGKHAFHLRLNGSFGPRDTYPSLGRPERVSLADLPIRPCQALQTHLEELVAQLWRALTDAHGDVGLVGMRQRPSNQRLAAEKRLADRVPPGVGDKPPNGRVRQRPDLVKPP